MRELLKKIGFEKTDTEYILRANEALGEDVRKLAAEFYSVKEKKRNESYKRTKEFELRVDRLATEEFHKYTVHLLFWLHCVPLMAEDYKKRGIPEELLYVTMKDLVCKTCECRRMYGVTGVFADWFFLFTDIKLFSLGRLQYEIAEFAHDSYKKNGFELKKGDRVYSCHIPSTGKLTKELYMASFQMAYEFFKDELDGQIIPIVCHSYLFWPPYLEKVFPENSNIAQFVKEFEMLFKGTYSNFGDCWRIFGRNYEGTTENFPQENELQRNFVKYINQDGIYGHAYGILLYDGEKRQIIK